MSAKTSTWLLAATLALCMSGTAMAQSSSPCDGPVDTHFPLLPWDFETNSDVEPARQLQFRAQIVSCVLNHGQAPLFVNWLIPGPTGFALPGIPLPATPLYLRDPSDALLYVRDHDSIKGCLEYGYRGDSVAAPFLTTRDQLDAVLAERHLGCRMAIVEQHAPHSSTIVERLENLVVKITNYLASDSQNPKATLVKLTGTAGVRVESPTSYQSFFNYSAIRVEGSQEGNISDLTIRPEFRGPAESLLGQYNEKYGKDRKLRPEDSIVIEVGDVHRPALFYARYAFYDKRGVLVGAVSIPMFVRSER